MSLWPNWDNVSNILMAGAIFSTLFMQWRNNRKLEVIHKATNSLTDRLVASTKADALQTGRTQGRAEQVAADNRASPTR